MPEDAPITAKVSVVVNESTPTFYVNNAEVGHTAYDFSVTCSKIPVKLPADMTARVKADGKLDLEALVQVVLPPGLIPGLIRALTVQKGLYEERYGEINDPQRDSPDGHRSEH